MKTIFISILIICCSMSALEGQQEVITADTIPPSIQGDDYQEQKNRYTLFSAFGGKPGRAALYGLVLPAAGQFYNRKYIKGSLFLIGELSMLAYAIDRQNYFNCLDEDYKVLISGATEPLKFGIDNPDTIYAERQSARQQKDYMWLGFGLVHLFVIAEAFVDRHLMEFDVTDDLSFKIQPFVGPDFISFTYSLN